MKRTGVSLAFVVALFVLLSAGSGAVAGTEKSAVPTARDAANDCTPADGIGYISGDIRNTNGNTIDGVATYAVVETATNETVITGLTNDSDYRVQVDTGEYYVRASANAYEDGRTAAVCVKQNRTVLADIVLREEATNESGADASVVFTDQRSTGESVTVESATLGEGGFLVVREESQSGSVVGVSPYLDTGSHRNIVVTLRDPLDSGNRSLVVIPHRDSDGDRSFALNTSDVDPPYTTSNGTVVSDTGTISITGGGTDRPPEQTTDGDTDRPSEGTTSDPVAAQDSPGEGADPPWLPIGAGVGAIVLVGSLVSLLNRRSGGHSDGEPSEAGSASVDEDTGVERTASEGTKENARGATTSAAAAGGVETRLPTDLHYDDIERGERIGGGGNADVYRATVRGPDGPVDIALKEPRIDGTVSIDQVESVLEEARTWHKLDDNDHIVDVLDWGSEPLPWIAMEYMDGGNLDTALPMDFDRGVDVLLAVANATEYAHRAGVAHGDLKPANVLFTERADGTVVKVGDWGLAKVLLEHSRSTEGLSPAYAAPEQFQGGSQDIVGPQLTDIYQLGAVAYEVFTGRPPFEGTPFQIMEQVRSEQPTPPTEVDPSIPPAVDDIVLTAMAKDPDDRYEAMIDLRRALEGLDSE